MNSSVELDTIAAIATPPGVGGIAIVRISGSEALAVISKLIPRQKLAPNKLVITSFHELNKTKKIDQVVVSFFKSPDSFTGEDTVEINCHGSIYITNKILEECLKAGARLALPGEFTKRAFLAGKIDLTQVEAIAEMIAAKTDLSAQLALKHLEGTVSKQIKTIRQKFLELLAEIEASVDFPEEIAEPQRRKMALLFKQANIEINDLIQEAKQGQLIKNGITVVLAGRTNVGKSSLFNYLVRENKAIVTDIHGTTRDALEAEISLQGIKVNLVDTAGIRKSQNKIELIGIEKSKEHVETAEIVLYLLDAADGFTKADEKILSRVTNKNIIFALNKIDLRPEYKYPKAIGISSKTGQGISKLETAILKFMDLKNIDINKKTYISSLRQKQKLLKVKESLETLRRDTLNVKTLDLLAIEVKNIVVSLGEITGDEVSEEAIEHIFANFCVGK